jgi:hypothetical protein
VHDGFALCVAVLGVGQAQHVHFDACRHQGHHRVHVLRNAGRGVQRDRGPHQVDLALEMPWRRRKSRATLAPSTSKRSVRAAVLMGIRPMS